ncbi:MAG: AEC family transporter [Gammaproteobacteria bacterium]|nr:AEC family transporter [Sideroxydans sp.]MBU3903651.1 AEC family transporter [Gammaproteobacteria bacterium]MBU4045339.1 AEC family transporter [Gammaproteobacteria bacterium]MBU4151210.1 AEC family transporter [Gammaproteobacteria bacterium]
MNNLILLILCFLAGMLLRRMRRMPDNAPATLNGFIIHVSLPALTLLYIHEIQLSGDVLLTALMAWIVFGLSAAFFWAIGRWLSLPRKTTGALIVVGGLGNTSFFGLPMVDAFYGKEGLATAIVADQLGSFFVLSVLGITVAGIYSSGRPSAAQIVKRIASFPPFISLAIAFLLIPVEYADWFTVLLKRLGDTLAPLALLSVGLQLRLGHIAEHKRNLALGLGFKLILAPLAIYLLYVEWLGAQGLAIQVTLFEAAMPSMITAAIVAKEHDLDPDLSNLMVAVGLILSFFTLSAWWYLWSGV